MPVTVSKLFQWQLQQPLNFAHLENVVATRDQAQGVGVMMSLSSFPADLNVRYLLAYNIIAITHLCQHISM
jgi:hypothetical protein